MGLMHTLFGVKPDQGPNQSFRPTRISPGSALPPGAPRPDLFDFTPIDRAMFESLTDGMALAADQSHGMLWILCGVTVSQHPDGSRMYPLVAEVPNHGCWMLGQPIPVDVYQILVHNKHHYKLMA